MNSDTNKLLNITPKSKFTNDFISNKVSTPPSDATAIVTHFYRLGFMLLTFTGIPISLSRDPRALEEVHTRKHDWFFLTLSHETLGNPS